MAQSTNPKAHPYLTPYTHKLVRHPETPVNASPLPWLTSLHATWRRGPYGRADYRGNCSGYLIKDLLRYFGATRVLDPMTGGGTCRDVCDDLGIECHSFDLQQGQDANDWASYRNVGRFDFVWLHPPYWRQIVYSDDERCLSNAPTLSDFVYRMRGVLRKCRAVLTAEGRIAVLMGNYSDHGRFVPLVHFTMKAALDEGLWPACTEIVRLQYHNSSSKKTYHSSFIPGVHDVCMVFHQDG